MKSYLLVLGILVVLLGMTQFLAAAPQADLIIYDDNTIWEDWSWDSTVNLASTSPVQGGAHSIAVTFNAAWAGFSLRTGPPVNTSGYTAITFWAHGGSSGTRQLTFYTQSSDGGGDSASINLNVPSGVWTPYTMTLTALGNPAAIARINLQENTGAAQPAFYIDNIQLVISAPPPPPPAATLTLTVDVAANRKPISPYIYGLNLAKESFAVEIGLPVRRWGGNDTTRYNWQNNGTNHGSDWFFHNSAYYDPYTGNDQTADQWVDQNERTGAASLITVPMMGYVAKDGDPNSCGFKVSKYGAQDQVDSASGYPDCGNGLSGGVPLTGNDPLDTSIAVTQLYASGWVNHLAATHGAANAGGVRFYALDNEPELWSETHRDVHPSAQRYDELRDRSFAYGAAIKAADPAAQIFGYTSFGWTGYWYSKYDVEQAAQNGYTYFPDYATHGNRYQVEWYLQQMQQYQQTHGVRLLDYLDLHFYPANGVGLTTAGDANRQALRLRSTRSLWDPTYRDESWIGGDSQPVDWRYVRLIPRMRDWISTYYPGTRLAITEYNWGGLEHINGALAQADLLGIFGREGLDLAALWNYPGGDLGYDHFETLPGAYAFRMYRNYDGAGAGFGDVSVSTASGDQGRLSLYAAQRSGDDSLTLMIINKTMTTTLTATLSIANFTLPATAQVYRYSDANLNAIVHLPDQAVGASGFTASFPANSITLVRLAGQPLNNKVYLPLVIR